jgi:hypothetical protein
MLPKDFEVNLTILCGWSEPETTHLVCSRKLPEGEFSHLQVYFIEQIECLRLMGLLPPLHAVLLGMSHSRMFDNANGTRFAEGETTMAQRHQRGWLKKEKRTHAGSWHSLPQNCHHQCSDCGLAIREPHTEICERCRDVFCPSCLFFHEAEHPKPAKADDRQTLKRKTG